jgi:hypothetical protein
MMSARAAATFSSERPIWPQSGPGSRDIGRIWRVAEALEYGIVGIKEGIISTEIAPDQQFRLRSLRKSPRCRAPESFGSQAPDPLVNRG